MSHSHHVVPDNEEGEKGAGEENSDIEIDHVQETVLWRDLA